MPAFRSYAISSSIRDSAPSARAASTRGRSEVHSVNPLWHALATGTAPAESRGVARPIQAAGLHESTTASVRLPGHDGGAEMPEHVRHKMEAAFGVNFSPVRIHEGAHVEAVGALAYRRGTDIHFAPGQYQPSSQGGQELLGHELAHVVQQSQGRVRATTQAKGVDINDDVSLEREANEMGTRAARGLSLAARGLPASSLGGAPVMLDSLAIRAGSSPLIQRDTGKSANKTVAKEGFTWIPDQGGRLWYDTEKEAQKRLDTHPERDRWAEMRVAPVRIKDKTKWRVEMRNVQQKGDGGAKDAVKDANAAAKKDAVKDANAAAKDAVKAAAEGAGNAKSGEDTKEVEPWTADSKTFDAKADAEKRMAELKRHENLEWKQYRIRALAGERQTQGQKPNAQKKGWRVEMAGRLATGTKTFALTFDDGPHAAALGKGTNYTEQVLDTLRSKGLQGKAAFFVQTHVPFHGGSKIGQALIRRMRQDGHDVGIHTGGKIDHERHPKTFQDGRLESELSDAKERIKELTGAPAKLVRAVGGDRDTGTTRTGIENIYKKLNLTHLHWDIDGDQGGSHTIDKLTLLFNAGLSALTKGARGTYLLLSGGGRPSKSIVVLYHDIRPGTANNIGGVIDYIRQKVPGAGFDKP